jgi:hypothetical protein
MWCPGGLDVRLPRLLHSSRDEEMAELLLVSVLVFQNTRKNFFHHASTVLLSSKWGLGDGWQKFSCEKIEGQCSQSIEIPSRFMTMFCVTVRPWVTPICRKP